MGDSSVNGARSRVNSIHDILDTLGDSGLTKEQLEKMRSLRNEQEEKLDIETKSKRPPNVSKLDLESSNFKDFEHLADADKEQQQKIITDEDEDEDSMNDVAADDEDSGYEDEDEENDDDTENQLRKVAEILTESNKIINKAIHKSKLKSNRLVKEIKSVEWLKSVTSENEIKSVKEINDYFNHIKELLTRKEKEMVQHTKSIYAKQYDVLNYRLNKLTTSNDELVQASKMVTNLDKNSNKKLSLDSYHVPLRKLLTSLDTSSNILNTFADGYPKSHHIQKKVKANNSHEEGTFFTLCRDENLINMIDSLQVVNYDINPKKELKTTTLILCGTSNAVADEVETRAINKTNVNNATSTPPLSPSSPNSNLTSQLYNNLLQDSANGGHHSANMSFQSDTASQAKLTPMRVVTICSYIPEESVDCKGVIHWLGTHGQKQAYENPALFSPLDPFLVVLRASSRMEGDLTCLTGQKHGDGQFFETDSAITSWVMVELPEGLWLRPDHYLLSYYIHGDQHIPRNWVFQGSPDKARWTTLCSHEDDHSLDQHPHTSVWVLQNSRRGSGTTGAFRYFRVMQTGPNSSGALFLILSAIEIYGTLLAVAAQPRANLTDIPNL